jgi:CheY-like chemotaxis protein
MREKAAILIVDDDQEDHIILKDYFSDLNLQDHLSFVTNGQFALDYLESLLDDQLPQLIVLDLNMPILNGTQTLLELKRSTRYKQIQVVIYSTSENEAERRKCLSYGAVDYLMKPVTYDSGMKMVQYMKSLITL